LETPSGHRDMALYYLGGLSIAPLGELMQIGVPSVVMRRMLKDGLVANPARGIYCLNSVCQDPLLDYAVEAVSAPPTSIISLYSAAWLQGLIECEPKELWLSLPAKSWMPKSAGMKTLHPVQWKQIDADGYVEKTKSGLDPLSEIEIAGRPFRITCPAATVAALFAFSNKKQMQDIEIALEALTNVVSSGVSSDDIEAFAEYMGAGERILPYLAGVEAGRIY
jgi:hypothetical protein